MEFTLLNKFNSYKIKNILHIKDMEDLTKYTIVGAKRVTTKYGETVQLELEKNIMFLPTRYNGLSDAEIEALSGGAFVIQREGERNLNLEREMEQFLIQNAQYPVWE